MEINAVIRSPVENMVGVLISQGKTKSLWGYCKHFIRDEKHEKTEHDLKIELYKIYLVTPMPRDFAKFYS